MARKHNTNVQGGAWTTAEKDNVWAKGIIIPNVNKDFRRKDKCGSVMEYSKHGDRDSSYGWEVDHINPVANGGGDALSNLQPLNWKNNASKSDSTNWTCPK